MYMHMVVDQYISLVQIVSLAMLELVFLLLYELVRNNAISGETRTKCQLRFGILEEKIRRGH